MEFLESETRRKTNAKNKFLTALVVGALATGCTVYTASAATTTTADGYTAYYGSDIGDSVTGDSTNNYKIQIGLTGTSPASSSSNLYVSGNTTPDDNNTISGAAVRVVEGTYGGTQRPWGISTASIYGGNSYDDDTVTNNTVLVNGTANSTGSLYGGFSYVGDVTNNTVTIDDAAVITLPKDNVIVGGETYGGNADNNTVTINGGTITGPTTTSSHDLTGIIGGAAFSETTGAHNNTINLNGGTISGIDLYGGYVAYQNTEETNSTGNTVNVAAANSFSFNKIAYVQNLNFILPSTIQSGDTMLTTNTLELNGDLTVATTLNAQAASNFKAGDVVHLLAASIITNNGYSINLANTTFALPRVSRDLLGTVAQNGNDIDLTVAYASDSLNADTKSFAETALTSAALINDGANRLADTVGATAASALHDQNSQAAVFASTGYGDLRYNTGYHIDSNAWYGTLGVASEMKNSHGTFLYAPFLEYGHTNYDSYLNDGLHGSGDAKYFGLGLWLKQTNTNGTYFEGSLRGGKTTSNYTSNDFLSGTTTVNYDYGAHYYGFHVGLGHVTPLNAAKTNTLDTYARYFYTHQSGYDATIAGDDYTFDAVNSSWIRFGTRLTHTFNPNSSIYYGAGYQYQFTGNSTGYMGGLATDSPTLKGGTGLVELGFKQQLSKPVSIDASATDYFGREKGVEFKVNAIYKF